VVSQAIADAIASEHWEKSPNVDQKQVIGVWDLKLPCQTLRGRSVRASLRERIHSLLAQPSPTARHLLFCQTSQMAIPGVMITASHNAPRYKRREVKRRVRRFRFIEQWPARVEVLHHRNEQPGRPGAESDGFRKAREANLIQKFNPLACVFRSPRAR